METKRSKRTLRIRWRAAHDQGSTSRSAQADTTLSPFQFYTERIRDLYVEGMDRSQLDEFTDALAYCAVWIFHELNSMGIADPMLDQLHSWQTLFNLTEQSERELDQFRLAGEQPH
jgi:hypothetical protein